LRLTRSIVLADAVLLKKSTYKVKNVTLDGGETLAPIGMGAGEREMGLKIVFSTRA